MLADFVKAIAEMAKSETRFERFAANDGREIVRLPDGTTEYFDRVPDRRRFVTGDVSAFCQMLTTEAESKQRPPMVLVDDEGAVGYFDPEFRDECVMLLLSPSKSLNAIRKFELWHDQKAAVAILRDELWGCCDASLLAAMRSLDFTRRNDGSRTIEHGRESLGKSIEAKVQSRAAELAEFYDFEVPVFAQEPVDAFRVRIHCALDLDGANERVRIVTRGDGLLHAQQRAAKYLRDLIAEGVDESALVVIAGDIARDDVEA